MGGELLYLDSSALVKLVMPEAETAALLESLAAWPARVTSELAGVEVLRAARRVAADPALEQRAEEVMAGVHLLKMDADILSRAARLEPRSLRSLDAVHLASALSLGDDLGAIAVCDGPLATAAGACGLDVVAPTPAFGPDREQLGLAAVLGRDRHAVVAGPAGGAVAVRRAADRGEHAVEREVGEAVGLDEAGGSPRCGWLAAISSSRVGVSMP